MPHHTIAHGKRRRVRAPSVAALLLLLGAGGCSGAPDADKELDTLRSWVATARFADQEFRACATTATYTAEIREVASKALDDTRKQLAQGAFPDTAARKLRPVTDSLAGALRQLDAELAGAAR